MNALISSAKKWAKVIKRDVIALWIAARDRRTPLMAKVVAGSVAAYALSPIDLIPDFIPVLGYLDDLILVPLCIMLAVRLVPAPLMVEFRATAAAREGRPMSRIGATGVIVLWLAGAALTVWAFWPLHIRMLLV